MKRQIRTCCLLLWITGTGVAQTTTPAGCDVVGPLQKQWEITRDLVLPLAKAIPEDKYDYKPTPEVRSFREQLIHVISENQRFMAMVADEKPRDQNELQNLKTREQILKTLE